MFANHSIRLRILVPICALGLGAVIIAVIGMRGALNKLEALSEQRGRSLALAVEHQIRSGADSDHVHSLIASLRASGDIHLIATVDGNTMRLSASSDSRWLGEFVCAAAGIPDCPS